MKYFISILLLFFLSGIFFKAQAQQKHFIYIESENNQAFAVVLNSKVYSSSDYGYVIVPKLSDGDYNFTVSFPLNKYPDQNFKCVISKKDLGYKLQSTTDKGWALQNMQTQKILGGNNTTASADNAFSNMLSDVVSDSNLANKNLPVNNSKPDTVAAASSNIDTSNVAVVATPVTDTAKTVSNMSNNGSVSSTDSVAQLQKISETKLDTGTNMVFVDKTAGADTINVFVPVSDSININTDNIATTTIDSNLNQQPVATATSNLPVAQPENNTQKTDTVTTFLNQPSTQITDTASHAASNPFYNSSTQNSNTNIVTPANTNNEPANANLNAPKVTNAVKDNCTNMISDNDMDKLKRKMFVQNNDNGMVQTALKYVGDKCLTTDQVKTLGNIFSSDDGRYNLYDALYKNVYDYGNYTTLESQIIDPYYKHRFEAMLR